MSPFFNVNITVYIIIPHCLVLLVSRKMASSMKTLVQDHTASGTGDNVFIDSTVAHRSLEIMFYRSHALPVRPWPFGATISQE